MTVFCEPDLFVKRQIGDHINCFCTKCFYTVQRFINGSFSQASPPICRNGAERFQIGIVGPAVIPQAAILGLLAARIDY